MNKHFSLSSNPNGMVTVKGEALPKGGIPNVIFLCQFGSRLYGTQTPESDYDYKAIFVAPLEDIVLRSAPETINVSTGTADSHNTPEDFDIEFIEFRKFIRDLWSGQTYAYELIFAPSEQCLVRSSVFSEWVDECVSVLSISATLPFLGYARTQAKKYGMKGERLTCATEALTYLKKLPPKMLVGEACKREDFPWNAHVQTTKSRLRGQDKEMDMLSVAGKMFNYTVPVSMTLPVITKLINTYGERAFRASSGMDWKALSHAVRVSLQLEELLDTGKIEFPLKDADHLVKIKRGEVPQEQVQTQISDLIQKLEERVRLITTQANHDLDPLVVFRDFVLEVYGVPRNN